MLLTILGICIATISNCNNNLVDKENKSNDIPIIILIERSNIFLENAKYTEAAELAKKAMDKACAENNELMIIQCFCQSGKINAEMGKYTEAEVLFKKALELLNSKYKNQYADMILAINDLFLLYIEQYRLSEAEQLLKQGLNIVENLNEKNDVLLELILRGFAVLYERQEKYDASEKLFKQDLELIETAKGVRP